jgi:hypothetical protein
MVKWVPEDASKMPDIESRTTRSFTDNKSYLTIDRVSANDSGRYTCIVNNGIGQASNATVYLIVKRKQRTFFVACLGSK